MQGNEEPMLSYLPEVEELLDEYPWFSVAHQVKLKIMLASGDERFANTVSLTAAYTVNREQLYAYLYLPKSEVKSEADDIDLMLAGQPIDYVIEGEATLAEYTETPGSEPVTLYDSGEFFALEEGSTPVEEEKESVEDLLEKFIVANPKIIPGAADKVGEEIKLSDSADGIVSETLANIYAQQGFYTKAIQVYKELSLQNPKKRAYFASLIKKMKDNK